MIGSNIDEPSGLAGEPSAGAEVREPWALGGPQ